MFYIVYKITNLVNNKIYIGVHKTKDINDDYMGSGVLIKKSQEKYGIENFTKEILEVFNNPEDMFNMECQLVNEDFVSRTDTYNLKKGGFGGFDYINNNVELRIEKNKKARESTNKVLEEKYGKDWKKIISKKASESRSTSSYHQAVKTMREKYGDNAYKNNVGNKHTDETKKKIGEANSKHQSGKGNSQYGTMWVHSLTEKVSKKIKKEEFSTYEQQGWLKGRKMKF